MQLHKPSSFAVSLFELRKIRPEDLPKPGDIGIVNEHYSVRLGNTTIITGYPSCGKSYLLLNMQIALTIKYGWKHLLFTPEMGDPEDLVLTLVEIFVGARGWQMTDQHIAKILPIIDEHFSILTFPNTPTMEQMCKVVDDQKGKIQTFSIDNMNDLLHNISGTQDIYYEQQIVQFNEAAKRNKVHGFLTAHPRNPEPDELNLPPEPRKIKGGSAFWSKGQTIMSLLRRDRELTICWYKIKPRVVGKAGTIKIEVDFDRNTYFSYFGADKTYLFEQAGHQSSNKQREAF